RAFRSAGPLSQLVRRLDRPDGLSPCCRLTTGPRSVPIIIMSLHEQHVTLRQDIMANREPHPPSPQSVTSRSLNHRRIVKAELHGLASRRAAQNSDQIKSPRTDLTRI